MTPGRQCTDLRIARLAIVSHRRQAFSTLGLATVALAVTLGPGDTPPTEIRLFTAGWNDTEHGRFLFDEEAAASVMAHYAKWGVDLMIDLEHQSLDSNPSPDPTSKDARGWGTKLELRAGDLWSVAVAWTDDGAARLSGKRQRYISPAFKFDPETKRITQLVNVAITSLPATHDTPALIAASATKGMSMDPSFVAKSLDAVEKGDSKAALEILKGLLASAAGGEAADPEDDPPPAGDGGADEGTETSGDLPQPAEPNATGKPADKKDQAAASIACSITGKTDPGEAMAELGRTFTVARDLETREAKLSADRMTLEIDARKKNAAQLVALGAETPFTSGLATFADGKKGKLAKRLLDEPIADQNVRVSALLAARGGKLPPSPVHPPAGGGDETPAVSPKEAAMLSVKAGGDPAKLAKLTAAYVKTKADIAARSNAPRAQEG